MIRRNIISMTLALGISTLLLGCTQQANVAGGFANAADQATSAKPAANAPAAVAKGHGSAAAQGGTATDAREPQFNTPAETDAAATLATNPMRPLSLFGQIASGEPERASALDSPDSIRRVTFAAEGADFDPHLDPTGQWLVYASTQHRKTSDLYLKRVEGSAVTQLTNDPGNDVMPVFSPDGKRIAFASDRSGNWDIYVMDVAGGQPVQVTNDATDDIHPSFSPDGKQLVYCSHGAQSGQWELVVVDIDNPATKRFIGYGLLPNWSPVENKIVFQRSRERGTRWFSVWTLDYVNGEGVRPTEIAASSNAAAITPNWSPDGKRLVFCTVMDPSSDTQSRPRQADVWIIAADGTGRTNLTHSPFANLQPVWARDGGIYFVSNRSKDGTENIYAIRPDRAVQVAQSVKVTPTAAAPAPAAARSAAVAKPLVAEPARKTALVPTEP